ncbi:hypothetical protein D7036_23535 [Aquimarina sp. BL5]|uniref:hypothetical protein n=1 Tax=Aquimarina sp. BL5 TaxID=1714860 RepID=UPI000EA90A31|nr:hypothetical protein [Aquimarina sp. BL5]RKM91128.1 hypothetical protein D7036_23535 [Aquimarina sp. BL5]
MGQCIDGTGDDGGAGVGSFLGLGYDAFDGKRSIRCGVHDDGKLFFPGRSRLPSFRPFSWARRCL